MYCKGVVIVSFVLLLSTCYCLQADVCNQPILFQDNISLDVCDTSCGDTFSNNTINCKLSFPSQPLLTVLLQQTHWVTGVRIYNTDSATVTVYSLAYTDRGGANFISLSLSTLYNSSLPSGDLVEVGMGDYLLVKLKTPVQPVSLSVFGYGAVGSDSCISVELFGCLPHILSYPIHTPNLLQYRFTLPDNLYTNSTGVEHGYWYGSDGVLTDGIEYAESMGCLHTECLSWEASTSPSGLFFSFSLYQPATIQTIEFFQTNTIDSITIKSPGIVPPYHTTHSLDPYKHILTFESPINTDHIQIVITFHDTLTLTEITLNDSYGNNVLRSVVSINEDVAPPDYLTALIASTTSLLSLFVLSFFTIIAFAVFAYRTRAKLYEISAFYDTLPPESFAVYTSIKRSPKYREYANVARTYSNIANGSDKFTQPLPNKPETVVRCMSETSSLAFGDYEKIDNILRELEANKNSITARYCMPPVHARVGLMKSLSNSLNFFSRNRNIAEPEKHITDDVIIYNSSEVTQWGHSKHASEDPYTPYNPAVITQKIPPGEDTNSNDHIPLTMSVSNNRLYRFAASRHSPTQEPANFQFVEDISEMNARKLASITLSQLDASISSDSV